MPATITMSVKIRDDVTGRLNRLKARVAANRFVMTVLAGVAGRKAKSRLKRRGRSPWGTRPSGRLARSFVTKVTDTGFSISSDLPYAGIQQKGGTIYPKKGKYMTIPVDPRESEFTAANTAGLIFTRHAEARIGSINWHGPALVDSEGVVRFALIRKAKIKARPYLFWDRNDKTTSVRIVRQYFIDTWHGRGRTRYRMTTA